MPTVKLLIQGKVQGVFYRAAAKDKARELHITGWIRNTPDEKVEAVVSGSQEKLQTFVEWCKKGPQRAEVSEVIATAQEEINFETFEIVR
ncbi:MAG TPA: acylphosphatase [Segetibacter sp.]